MSRPVRVRAPHDTERELLDVIADVQASPVLAPFDDLLVDYVAEFSRRLGRSARGYAEIQALAFWMRRAELVRMRDEFAALATDRTMLMPRGIVFHIPPSNVDTIFIYSWLLALLCGNRNVVRLSSRSTEQTDLILGVIQELAHDPRFHTVTRSTAMLTYGHDDAITGVLSAAADLRVIWGGDGTVEAIRRSPLAPHASDLTFPDRVSLAVLDAAAIASLDDPGLDELAERFYNDAYWFNQLGCSSPRTVVWVGDDERAAAAETRFFKAVHAVARRKGLVVEAGTAIAKLTHGYSAAITERVSRVRGFGNEVLVVDTERLSPLPADFVGAGTFHSARVDALVDVAAIVTRRHQTLSHEGFSTERLVEFVDVLRGRGIDRLVPIGEALTFNRYWDGNDLFQSFTRRVYVAGNA